MLFTAIEYINLIFFLNIYSTLGYSYIMRT